MLHIVPKGLDTLLSMAATHEPFAQALLTRRLEAASAAGVVLGPSERTLLSGVTEKRLRSAIDVLRGGQKGVHRRAFLKRACVAMLVLGAGVAASACIDDELELGYFLYHRPARTLGIRPGRSPLFRRDAPPPVYTTPKGADLGEHLQGKTLRLFVDRFGGRGPLSESAVRDAVEAQGQVLCACYLIMWPRPHPFGACVRVRMSIAASGTVEEVVFGESTFGGFTMINSMKDALAALDFPEAPRGTSIYFELAFEVEDH